MLKQVQHDRTCGFGYESGQSLSIKGITKAGVAKVSKTDDGLMVGVERT
tara:strand:+ start:692 stop:838 length:147 start_codon:yes stop_codon:yes gene_type:complete